MREHANEAAAKRQKVQLSSSDKRAQVSALAVRALIIGPTSSAEPKMTPAIARPQLSKIKSQLMEPKSANKVIAQLRQLPATGELSLNGGHSNGPIHAVCLAYTDVEEHNLHFSKLTPPDIQRDVSVQDTRFPGIVSAPLDALAGLFNEMHVVDLITSPDFGLGQPGNGEGLLAGAVPTAETVINGVKQITPQLMALGYATGQAIKPDHSGIYPPTDRMSVLTYWWGLEVLLPPPSLVYLSSAQSISGAVMNFLSALSLINNGVREILPFIRYISQFIDFEFSAIKKQDKGQGVVCAATWIMPAAMVPRPWDFPTQPPAPDNANEKPDPQTGSMGPAPIVSPPSNLPKPVYSVIDTVVSPADKPVSRPSAQPDTSPSVN
ncbi:hypothetical protein GALMADRAFT_1331812 [Galerina marginata CBS 339.88]|uniref:Uncharacterized protein n=1 Tax=Galerina marginata (strain CBS 339.88) TaxID=685588 RepID=A0A067SYF9_GALM3|nr:hypothetical protein GALMADRAFT_1331812 [Galerina marginata CBS 339.88]